MKELVESKETRITTGGNKMIGYKEYMDYAAKNYKNIVNKVPRDFNLKDNAVWIFHHTDLDGYASGHLAERYTTSLSEKCIINLIPSDYHTDFERYEIYENDLVFLVDLSFTEDTAHKLRYLYAQTKNIYWIDHHESNVKLLKQDESLERVVENFRVCVLGGMENKYSAAMLVYCTLFETIPEYAPEYIKLTSDWDTWTHEMEDSIYFNEAMNGLPNYKLITEDGDVDMESEWIKLWYEKDKTNHEELEKVIDRGKPIVDDTRRKNARYLAANGFEFELLDYSMLCCNQRSNSLLFGDKINDYDLLCPFVLQERNGKLVYTYSLFSNKEYLNCADIAKIFGGGGHKGAAGFSLPFNIFTDSKRLGLYLSKKKKEIKKLFEKQYE